MDAETLCPITASVPECLWPATTRVFINSHRLNALLNSSSSESFIDEVTPKFKIEIRQLNKETSMTLTIINSQTCSFCIVDL